MTLGAAILTVGAFRTLHRTDTPPSPRRGKFILGYAPQRIRSWLTALGEILDIRLFVIGSLLPDIIDKPLGMLNENLSNGRIYSHTLLFLTVLGVAAWYQQRRTARRWLLALWLGTGAHLVLDSMWQTPETLFWPLYGWAFTRLEIENFTSWMQELSDEVLRNPAVYLPEIIGVIVLGWFLWHLLRRRLLFTFLRRGKVS